jgi:hypothetical protein
VSSHSRDQTSMQELELAKALKPSKKFGSGLSLSNKATVTKIKTGRGGMSSTSTGFGGASQNLKALDLFNSGSSVSDAEGAKPVPCQKRP